MKQLQEEGLKLGVSQKENEAPSIDYDKCISCGKCASLCPMQALILEKIAERLK